jgi:hypothetical protein
METTMQHRAERTIPMAEKNITPTNPDTNATDEVEEQDQGAERKTMSIRCWRKMGRKTMGRVH